MRPKQFDQDNGARCLRIKTKKEKKKPQSPSSTCQRNFYRKWGREQGSEVCRHVYEIRRGGYWRGKKAPICSVCQFLSIKYSDHDDLKLLIL